MKLICEKCKGEWPMTLRALDKAYREGRDLKCPHCGEISPIEKKED